MLDGRVHDFRPDNRGDRSQSPRHVKYRLIESHVFQSVILDKEIIRKTSINVNVQNTLHLLLFSKKKKRKIYYYNFKISMNLLCMYTYMCACL